MGGMELEAQVAGHAFDGELGAGHGMDHGERTVDHMVNDTQKYSSTRRARPQMRKAPRERMLAGRLEVWALFDTAAQVFSDFVHALKRGARLFA